MDHFFKIKWKSVSKTTLIALLLSWILMYVMRFICTARASKIAFNKTRYRYSDLYSTTWTSVTSQQLHCPCWTLHSLSHASHLHNSWVMLWTDYFYVSFDSLEKLQMDSSCRFRCSKFSYLINCMYSICEKLLTKWWCFTTSYDQSQICLWSTSHIFYVFLSFNSQSTRQN